MRRSSALLVWISTLVLVSSAKSQTPPPAPYTGASAYLLAKLERPAPKLAPIPKPKAQVPLQLKYTRHPLVIPTPKATRAYHRTFRVLRNRPQLTDRYDELILKYAGKHELDPRILKAVIAAESEFNPIARSPVGARGLMQLMPRTAEGLGVSRRDLEDPEQNIKAGAAYVAHLYARTWRRYNLKGVRYQDAPVWVVQRVIAAYHAGPRFLFKDRWFRSTRLYVRKVILFYQSDVTDIRRLPLAKNRLPDMRLIQASSGSFN